MCIPLPAPRHYGSVRLHCRSAGGRGGRLRHSDRTLPDFVYLTEVDASEPFPKAANPR
jgi:hypothetical protein